MHNLSPTILNTNQLCKIIRISQTQALYETIFMNDVSNYRPTPEHFSV